MKVYNTLTRKKEEFLPQKEGVVKIYVCGPTVYDYSHLGHARAYVAFDVIIRYLRYKGYKVKYVQNITDVEDKIIKRAKEQGTTIDELTKKYENEYLADMDALGILRPDIQPHVTDHIPDIITLIKALIDKGFAYEVDGDVYYSVSKFKTYSRLGNLNEEQLKAGARIEPSDEKKDQRDFALWKKSKAGEPAWSSPWGKGRPGWHIECSAMSMKYLGETLDIHGGGQDLIFPHHTNEIAQSEAATGKQFSKYWLHNGFVKINKEKMSKSLGNFVTMKDILKSHDPKSVRFFLLSTSYRGPIDFSDQHLVQAKASLERLNISVQAITSATDKAAAGSDKKIEEQASKLKTQFTSAMDDDFNTTQALAVVFELAKLSNTYTAGNPKKGTLKKLLKLFKEFDSILQVLDFEKPAGLDSEIQKLVDQREAARKEKNYKLADKIRADLKKKGIILEDTDDGVTWRYS